MLAVQLSTVLITNIAITVCFDEQGQLRKILWTGWKKRKVCPWQITAKFYAYTSIWRRNMQRTYRKIDLDFELWDKRKIFYLHYILLATKWWTFPNFPKGTTNFSKFSRRTTIWTRNLKWFNAGTNQKTMPAFTPALTANERARIGEKTSCVFFVDVRRSRTHQGIVINT